MSRPPANGSTFRGALLVSLALAALIFGLSYGQQHSFASAVTIGTLVMAVLLAGGFIIAERATVAPMLPFAIFADATRRAAVIAMLLMGAVVAGYVYFISLYLQRVLGFSPVGTGLALIPATATVAVTATLGARRLLALWCQGDAAGGTRVDRRRQVWLAHITAGGSYASGVLPGLLFTAFGMESHSPPPRSRLPAASKNATRASPADYSPPANRSARTSVSPYWRPPRPLAPPTQTDR